MDELFDKSLQEERFAGMKDFLPELLALYRSNVATTMDKLRASIMAKDMPGLSKGAHTLKGMSAVVCAQAVQNLSAELEVAAQKEDVEASMAIMARLEDMTARTTAYLEETQPKA